MSLDFIGQTYRPAPGGTASVVLTIHSDFPTIANAGVRVLKDNGDGTISQVGQGVVIDTSINTPQGDSALLALNGPGKYAVTFQGQATSIAAEGGVKVGFSLTQGGGALLEDFSGPLESSEISTDINGAAFVEVPA